jgi:hypothetical protein
VKSSAIDLRSIVDKIVLRVAEAREESDLRAAISDRTMEYLTELREQQSTLTDADMNRIASRVIKGVLTRLEQIAIGGGQIGSA